MRPDKTKGGDGLQSAIESDLTATVISYATLQEKHVKQDELAEYLGVSFQAVSKWETGASTPDISLLPKLAMYFGISIDELFEMSYEEKMERIENMFWHEARINEKTFDKAVSFLTRTMNVKRTIHEFNEVMNPKGIYIELLKASGDFSREIDLLLGYPIANVKAFIERKGQNCCSVCGDWKVYSNEDAKRKISIDKLS